MTEQHAAEAATIEAMHTGDYSAPDLEYTPITDPLPAVVRADELARLRARVAELEADRARARADIMGLCDLMRRVRYAQPVGEMQRLQRECERTAARWGLGVQP